MIEEITRSALYIMNHIESVCDKLHEDGYTPLEIDFIRNNLFDTMIDNNQIKLTPFGVYIIHSIPSLQDRVKRYFLQFQH